VPAAPTNFGTDVVVVEAAEGVEFRTTGTVGTVEPEFGFGSDGGGGIVNDGIGGIVNDGMGIDGRGGSVNEGIGIDGGVGSGPIGGVVSAPTTVPDCRLAETQAMVRAATSARLVATCVAILGRVNLYRGFIWALPSLFASTLGPTASANQLR
jgi:hypothetical protein